MVGSEYFRDGRGKGTGGGGVDGMAVSLRETSGVDLDELPTWFFTLLGCTNVKFKGEGPPDHPLHLISKGSTQFNLDRRRIKIGAHISGVRETWHSRKYACLRAYSDNERSVSFRKHLYRCACTSTPMYSHGRARTTLVYLSNWTC